jgi:hypothetical protein
MFNKLKSVLGDSATNTAIAKVTPLLKERLEKLDLDPTIVADDEKFTTYVAKPALVAVNASAIGLTNLIPNFDVRFVAAMLHVRDEIMVIDHANKKVSLVPDYQEKLSGVLAEALNKKAP